MGDLRIGYHDHGLMDRQDQILAKRTPLKTGLTAAQAESYVRERKGSEMILKMPDGTFNVYAVSISDTKKSLKKADFEDGTTQMTLSSSDVARLGASQAYLHTDDGTLRTLDIAGIELDSLDHSLIQADLELQITDKDGIESKSARDITGTLQGKIVMDRVLLELALAQAEQQTGLKFSLSDNPRDQSYRIHVSYGVSLGSITLRPAGTGIKVEIGGLLGGLADAADWLGKKLGYDPQAAVDQVIRQHIGTHLGLKVESQSLTEYQLAPDLQQNPLLQEIPLSPQTRLKVEEIRLDPRQGNGFHIDSQGNLELNFQGAQVIGSTQSQGPTAVADAEGPDSLQLTLQGQLHNDFSTSLSGEVGLSIQVQPAEQRQMKARIQEFSGQAIGVGGNFQLSGLKFQAQVNPQGQITQLKQQEGQLRFENLALDTQDVQLKLNAQNGILEGELKEEKYHLRARELKLKGQVKTPEGLLHIQQLKLSGELVVDPQTPQRLHFSIPQGQSISYSGQFTPTGQKQGMQISNLRVGLAHFQLDAEKGTLAISAQGKTHPKVSVNTFSLPDVHLNQLQVTGSLQADLLQGTLDLKAQHLSLRGQLGLLELSHLRGSGHLSWDPAKGLTIRNAQVSAQGRLGELEVKQLQGSGHIFISPTGQIRFSSTRDLQLQTKQGLTLKGNLSLDYTPGQLQVETISQQPVQIHYTDPTQGIDLKDISFSGKMQFIEETGELHFSNHADKPLELKSGQISGVSLKQIRVSNGQIKLQTQGGAFVVEPLPDQHMRLSGSIDGIQLEELRSQGAIRFDPTHQRISWDQPMTVRLPAEGIEELSTEGPMEVSQDTQGRLCFCSPGGTINLKTAQLTLSQFKVEGEVIFDPRTGQLSFNGLHGQNSSFKLSGQLNGYPIQAESSGQLRILSTSQGLELSGEAIKINGLVDGFTLQSPQGASGKVLIRPDGQIDLQALHFDVTVDDIQLQNRNGLFKSTPQGFEINLSGDIQTRQEQLMRFLQKFSARPELGQQAQAGIQRALDQINAHFGHFNQANIHFDNLVVRFDPNFEFQGFEVKKDTRLANAELLLQLGPKPEKVQIGAIHWRAEAEADTQGFRVKEGMLEFSLTQSLRDYIDRTVTQQLMDAGLRDVDLEVLPNGQIQIHNATYEVRARGRSGNNGTEIKIPLLSSLFKKPKKIMNISARLDITPQVENNQLLFKLEHLKLKGLLAEIINRAIDGEDKLADQVERQLKAEDIQYQRKDGETLFRIDLNDLIQKRMDPGIQIKDAQLSTDGQIRLNYTYQEQKP